MQPKIWPFIIVGFAVPMISGCTGTFVSCTTFFGPPRQFQTVDIPDAAATTVTGINNSGQVVGYSINSSGIARSFRGQPGSLMAVDPPPLFNGSTASSSEAYAINSRGNIIITGHYPAGAQSYLFDGTSFNALSFPATGRPLDNPRGINDDPRVVGSYYAPVGRGNFLLREYQYDVTQSGFRDVTIFDNMPTYLAGINNSGRMVGSAQTGGLFMTKAFYLAGPDTASAQTIEISGATSSTGSGINNAADPGCIKHVGTYWTADGNSHGFVHLQAGQLATFDVPGAVQTQAYGVNDNGDMSVSPRIRPGSLTGSWPRRPFRRCRLLCSSRAVSSRSGGGAAGRSGSRARNRSCGRPATARR
jgi:probable HAF family extracellular repeat protein